MSVNLSDIAILNIKGSECCCFISLTSKHKTINLLQNAYLTEKSRTLSIKNIYIYKCFSKHIQKLKKKKKKKFGNN